MRTDVFKNISGGTVVRPSIVRNNVLPTINQGVTVLKTIYGGTTRSVDKTGTTVQINKNINVINQQYGVTSKIGVLSGAVPSPTIGQFGQFRDVGFKQTGSIMGVDRRIGDNAADITYTSIRPLEGPLNKSIVMPKVNHPVVGLRRHRSPDIAYSRAQRVDLGTTTNNTLITSGITPNTFGTSSIMGVDRRIGDNAADITYTSIRPSQGSLNKSIVIPKVNHPVVGTIRHNSPDIAYSRAQRVGLGSTTNNTIITSETNPNVVRRGSFMDIDGIKGDNSANITYSTNPNTQNIALGVTNNPIITSGATPSSVIGNNNVVGFNGGLVNTVNTGQVMQGMPLGVNGVNTPIV